MIAVGEKSMPKPLFAALLVLASVAPMLAKDPMHDPRLRTVKTIFIAGNNKQALDARKMLSSSKKACFTLAPKADPDAVLDVKEAQESGITHTRGASAELTLKSGEMIWSDYRMAGGDRLMWQLIHDACR
jgi:hypothetical protein